MSERKSINKYYPPDFDPLAAEASLRKAAKSLKTKNKDVVTIRLMTPFSIRCTKCSEYIAKSRKFNGKKELLPDRYLDTIKIYRLSIKCPACNNVISFRTDPRTSDYVMECGGARNYTRSQQQPGQLETVDETLDRLVQEQSEAEREKLGGKGEDKVQLLEDRLAQIQREQQDDEQLEKTRLSRARMQRQEQRLRDHPIAAPEDSDLDALAEQAFQRRSPPATTPALQPPRRHPRTAPGAVFKRKSPRTNPLGVVRKRPRA